MRSLEGAGWRLLLIVLLQAVSDPIAKVYGKSNGIPDAELDPGSRGHLHHQGNVHKEAHQWEDRQSKDLWAESAHPWTQPRRLKGRPDPHVGRKTPVLLKLCVQCLLKLGV